MWLSRTLAAGCVLMAGPAHAGNAGRMDLLAGEVAQLLQPAAATVTEGGWLVLLGIPVVTMLAAFLGTWLGIRTLSFGRIRQKEGWREVAYRFRSDGQLTMGKDVVQRMSGVLDEIEDLGKKLQGAKATDGSGPGRAPATDSPAIARAAAAAGATPRRREPVTFARRDEPVASTPEVAVAEVAPQPIARIEDRPVDRSSDRGTRYRNARALLREGHDREAVRSMTGLKLAELDLLRCTPEPLGADS